MPRARTSKIPARFRRAPCVTSLLLPGAMESDAGFVDDMCDPRGAPANDIYQIDPATATPTGDCTEYRGGSAATSWFLRLQGICWS